MAAIHPNSPPPLPPQIQGRGVRRIDGTRTHAVTIPDAARLLGRSAETVKNYVEQGKVDVIRDTDRIWILIDSLWLLVPEEERRVS